jgi:type IV pilus assembly protein PilQ
VPLLGKIPLVGWLFKQQNVANEKRELLIFVTPKVIN